MAGSQGPCYAPEGSPSLYFEERSGWPDRQACLELFWGQGSGSYAFAYTRKYGGSLKSCVGEKWWASGLCGREESWLGVRSIAIFIAVGEKVACRLVVGDWKESMGWWPCMLGRESALVAILRWRNRNLWVCWSVGKLQTVG